MPRRKKEEQPQEEIKVIKTPPLLRGMKDVLPPEEKYWDFVEGQIKKVVRDYSFRLMRTPLLEKYELFNHTLFKQGGIVEKEIFHFIDKGEKVALRPEGTASTCRAYIDHNMDNQPQPIKLYYCGPMFRRGKVDAGKLRQFTQVGFEIIGDKSPAVDAELIIIGHYLLKNFGLDSEIRLNSIGCASCRVEYAKALGGYLKSKRGAVCLDCRKRMTRDPMKFLICKSVKCVKLKEDAPQTMDWLCDDCRNHLFKVLEYLDELKIPYKLDPTLLRTFDYYTKTVFEIHPLEKQEKKEGEDESARLSLAGGGRYDYLIQMLGGIATPAAGFTMGIERVISRMKVNKCEIPNLPAPDVFVAQISEQARQKTFSFFEALRKENFSVRANLTKGALKAQLDTAIKLGAKFVLILGQKEVIEGTVILRDMESGIQEVVNAKRVVAELKKKLKK
ncbi:histidine--tRNA ligase [Patescibacteria group bacterium]|nr:histidine--tRNA ligase [Patescibacteria group bacterium]